MSTRNLQPWSEVVKLHPDVEKGTLTQSVFALDLGAIAEKDPNVPAVYRDPEAFFRATYITVDLGRLLEEVLASLCGKDGYNRVLKLRTPFGGGKSHTLAALLHAARDRKSLNVIPEGRDFPDPGKVDVAVFDGEKFDAVNGKDLGEGRAIRTMWGWLAWQFGPEKYALVEEHDRDRVAPGGDVIRDLLSGGPKLILLDEVLKYMERGSAVQVHESTLRRQALDFFSSLTVEVARIPEAVLVYSLQWSSREAFGNVALLEQIDAYAKREDQTREPVAGDEILPVLQRRLLGSVPPTDAAQETAGLYADIVTGMQRADAETDAERRRAEDEGLQFRQRLAAAYPFHPALIDAMKERWCSIDAFQRTRGALRFLATCLRAAKTDGVARALLGPSEIPLANADVRLRLLEELGVKNDYEPVVTADITGPNARAKRIDDRLAQETPALSSVRPATRLATAILVYSFGGLRREGDKESETLPAGVTEQELLAACVGPDLDSITARAVLSELRNTCLYLHYDGVRYCFKKEPTVTKLIEDAEQEVSRSPETIKSKIREMLTERLAGHHQAVVWPEKSQDISDGEPLFLVGYLPLAYTSKSKVQQKQLAAEMLANYGSRPRRYRNGLGLAIPDKDQVESVRRAARYLLAIERIEEKKVQYRLTKDQLDELKERRRTEEGALESGFRSLYMEVWLPRIDNGKLDVEVIDARGRALQTTRIHERIMELLTQAGTPRLYGSVTPRKVAERVGLGECISEGEPPRLGISTIEVQDAFFGIIEPPRLDSAAALRRAIARGVADGVFAYTSGAVPTLGPDGKFQIDVARVVRNRPLAEDEVDLDSGFLMAPQAVPEPQPVVCPKCGKSPCECPTPQTVCPKCGEFPCVCDIPPELCPKCGQYPCACVGGRSSVRLSFKANRDQVFKVFPAIANLADKSDDSRVTIRVEGTSAAGYDPSWLRNAVEEPLDEADIEVEKDSE